MATLIAGLLAILGTLLGVVIERLLRLTLPGDDRRAVGEARRKEDGGMAPGLGRVRKDSP